MKTIVLKVQNLPNDVDTDLFVYCMQQDVETSYPKGKVELVPEIVRCKDCKHAELTFDGKICKYCDLITNECGFLIKQNRESEWFCADGERKKETV